MNQKLLYSLLAVSLSVVVAAPAHAAGDPARGATINAMCMGCHGMADWRTAYPAVYSVPKLGGQHAAYIVKALHEYKNGERNFATMHAIASGLTDQDMEDLAAYYSGGK